MKLVRYGPAGGEKPGLVDTGGRIRDLSSLLTDITTEVPAPERLAELAATPAESLPLVDGEVRLGPPVAGARQIPAIGLNFSDHAAETGQAAASEPILFTKGVSCIQGPDDDVRRPRDSQKMDWEVELAIVIGQRASYVEKAEALQYLAGFAVCDDLSEREFQMERLVAWNEGR